METRSSTALLLLIAAPLLVSTIRPYSKTAFNPEYPFHYPVPPVVNYILDHPTLNKSTVIFESPYAGIPREKIGDYYFNRVTTCGTHFVNLHEGYIISDGMFEESENQAAQCTWAFVGSQFCTPSLNCPKFANRIKITNNTVQCRTNYMQVSDGGESLALHFCEKEPNRTADYASTGGLLDVTIRYASFNKRPQFECYLRCVPYKMNFHKVKYPTENKSAIEVQPLLNPPQRNIPKRRISRKCRCGISNILPFNFTINNATGNRMPRILGGREAQVGQYPWMVALVHKDGKLPFCGGSLINDRYVLTAQHCLDDESVEDFEVVLNEHDFNSSSETVGKPIKRGIRDFIRYNHYLPSVFDGDVALLALDRPLDVFNPLLTPVCLPENVSNTYLGYDVIGTGWGTFNDSTSEKSPKLLEVGLRVMSNAACNDYHSSEPPVPLQISEHMLCSGFPEGGRDTCGGDSGGPLITFENERFTQIGVTSWGFGCGQPINPGVFARMTEFLEWIDMNTLDGLYCF